MDIPRIKWERQRTFRLDKGFRDAVADLLRSRWPSGTAKHAAREYGLTADMAREAVRGRASLTTLEQIVKSGGLAVGLQLIEAVTGDSLAHHFAELRNAHEDHGRRLAALFVDAGPGAGPAGGGAIGSARVGADGDDAAGSRVDRRAAAAALAAEEVARLPSRGGR